MKKWLNENLHSILVERVGSGSYGDVSRVNWPGIPKPVIIKINHNERFERKTVTIREAEVLEELNG